MRIRKMVLPVAGLGTRVLPATKVIPKEMLPLVDKPTLQYIVEAAIDAGIEEIIFVTSRSKRSIEDHFDAFPEMEQALERKGKLKELEQLRRIHEMATYVTVRQVEPRGLGHAILCAKEAVGNEPFAVNLGDNLVDASTPIWPRMMELHEQYGSSVLALFACEPEQISAYGIVDAEAVGGDTVKVKGLVEKPSPQAAPSNLAVDGFYIMTPDIFEILEKTPPSRRGEIEITDALATQARAGRCYGLRFAGIRYDTGTPLGLLTSSIALALQREELAPDLRAYMRQVLGK
ncbi:MAG: UTP--glucose-1-phosphate uridylyltransferase [Ktedonobacteraceae bacterium]|nr:UTP--glucose-1-phosphate uridylyltransferase [Ktedonobacteraceae bacterium]